MTEKQDSESTSESSGKGQKTDESGHVNAESKQNSGCVGGKKVANSGTGFILATDLVGDEGQKVAKETDDEGPTRVDETDESGHVNTNVDDQAGDDETVRSKHTPYYH